MFTLHIGEGVPVFGALSNIFWPISGNEHVHVEIDPSGGNNFVSMGISKLLSVPFALHANTSGDNKWQANGNAIYNNNVGYVGIGTLAPETKLHVLNPNNPTKLTLGAGDLATGTTNLILGTTAYANGHAEIQSINQSGLSYGNLLLNPSGGNVGIRLTDPDAPLHMRGNLHLGADNAQGGDGVIFDEAPYVGNGHWIMDAYAAGFPAANKLRIYHDRTGITVHTIMDNGNVGIGDFQYYESALAKLDVKGNVKIADGTQGVGKVLTSDADGYASWQTLNSFIETDPKVGSLTNTVIPKWNGTTLVDGSITDNGNIGIQTNTPQRALDVHGDIAQGLWTDNIPSRRIGVMDAVTQVAGMEIENTNLNGSYSQKLHLLSHHYANSFGRRFTLDEDGKVGIGTEYPQANLHVIGLTQMEQLKISNGASQGAVLTSDSNGNATWVAPADATIGCIVRAQNFSASASGTAYAVGQAFAPSIITSSGIYGDTRLINSGAYNTTVGGATTTGVFTAPVNGYYQVSVKAISVASGVRLILLASLNGNTPTEIYDMLTTNPCANCSDISHTEIVYLQAGDTHRILRSLSGTAISDMVIAYRKL